MKTLIIGAGNMGFTYGKGMSQSGLLKERDILVLDSSKERLAQIEDEPWLNTYSDMEDCVPLADFIFLAVKPYHAEAVLRQMAQYTNPQQILVSIMAGTTIRELREWSGLRKIVRAMPNLPAQVGEGVTSFMTSPEVSRLEESLVSDLLAATGTALKVNNERFIDASTGISGSGPAYVFYFMQSMIEAAIQMGFDKEDAKTLVSNTFSGAIKLLDESDMSPESWMNRVASKGGTTEAALDSMEDNNVNELIKEAAFAAFKRASEIGAN